MCRHRAVRQRMNPQAVAIHPAAVQLTSPAVQRSRHELSRRLVSQMQSVNVPSGSPQDGVKTQEHKLSLSLEQLLIFLYIFWILFFTPVNRRCFVTRSQWSEQINKDVIITPPPPPNLSRTPSLLLTVLLSMDRENWSAPNPNTLTPQYGSSKLARS